MKKTILAIVAMALVLLPAAGTVTKSEAFLSSAVAVNASTTATNGSEFTSVEVNAQFPPNLSPVGILMVTFTRAAGSATLTVDFYFQVTPDGTTWYDYVEPLSVETGHAVISGTTVRIARPVYLYGVHSIRLAKIVNSDTGNNLTDVNASVSF